MARGGLYPVVLVAVLAVSGCGMLPARTHDSGNAARPVPHDPCALLSTKTRDLLVPNGVPGGTASQGSPEPDATVASQCTLHSPTIGGPTLEVTAIRFPAGGAKRYSGFPTSGETYEACAKSLLRAYSDTTQLRERFDVGFGDRSAGAFDSGVSVNDVPVVDTANVCVLAGNDAIEVEYQDGTAERPASKEQLKQCAVLAAAETLRNLP